MSFQDLEVIGLGCYTLHKFTAAWYLGLWLVTGESEHITLGHKFLMSLMSL